MRGLVHSTRSSARVVGSAVAGAPRATLAVVLAATLVFASLLPQLALVNSEDMWLPQGERTDAYHALARDLGATEYVGVLATADDGRIVSAADFEALLALENAVVSNSSVAEAFRFPRDPGANALSVADLVAEADAVLDHRRATFAPLADALSATANSTSDLPTLLASVDQATASVRLAASMYALDPEGRGQFDHALADRILPEVEVAALSGTDADYKADAAELLLAPLDFANWSLAHAPLAPADPALQSLRALLSATEQLLETNASTPVKAAGLSVLLRSVLVARDVLDLSLPNAAGVAGLLASLSLAFAPGGDPDAQAAYANATASLARALLFIDRLSPVGDAEAATGIAAMGASLATLLDTGASAEARAAGCAVFARLFEVFLAMADRGLDLNVPQTNISYDSYSVALNENATRLGAAGALPGARLSAAENLSLSTTGFLGNLVNLNALGIFTDQASYQRVFTMVTFLNDTFALLAGALTLPDAPAALDPLASMVSVEVLRVVNTSAPQPHRLDLNASTLYATALRALESAVAAHGNSTGARSFERAAGVLVTSADFEALSLAPAAQEDLLTRVAESLESASDVLSGGGPLPARTAFSLLVGASWQPGARASLSGLAPPDHRPLLTIVQRQADGLAALLRVGQNPALFGRIAHATLEAFVVGLASPQGAMEGTSAPLLEPLRGMVAALPGVLGSGAVSNATKDLLLAQTFVGADLALRHLALVPPPLLPGSRAESASRIRAMGDAGVYSTLGVLLNTTAALPPSYPSIGQDARFSVFTQATHTYNPGVEQALRASFGFRTRTLLPNALTVSGGSIAAQGTVVLFLFNGSLDRTTLGARESALRDIAKEQSSGAVAFSAFGFGLMWYDTQAAMDLSVVLFALTMVLVMGAALWAVYRNLFDVLLTVALLGFTVVWVLGTAALLGIAINPVTQVIPVLLIGLAEDYAVHLTIGYRRKRAQGKAPRAAVLAAVVGIGAVLFVATVTNGLSFLSFGGSDIALIKDFGTLMALGLAYSFLLTLTLIPAATVWRDRRLERRRKQTAAPAPAAPGGTGEKRKRPPPTASERAIGRVVRTSLRHPVTTLLVVALLTAASAIGATTLATTFSYDQITARDLEVVRTLNAAQDGYPAGFERAFIVVEGQVDDPGVFLALDAAAHSAEANPYVVAVGGGGGATSVVSYLNGLGERIGLEGSSAPGYTPAFVSAFSAADRSGDGRLAADDNLTRADIAALYGAVLDDPLGSASEYVHRGASGFDRAAVRVEVHRAVEHGEELTLHLEADADLLRAQSLSAHVSKVTVTGLPLLNREVMQAVQDSGWQSVIATLVLALVVLTAFFWAAFRSLALGPLTIAPTLIAVAWTLGAMVALGLSLNMMTVMIATTTIGMGDLYAIHISYSYYRELKRRASPLKAADAMVREAGAPLLEASATTALGFLILVFAPVPVVQSYGLIFAASIVFAFLYSIVVMPILVLGLARANGAIGFEVPE